MEISVSSRRSTRWLLAVVALCVVSAGYAEEPPSPQFFRYEFEEGDRPLGELLSANGTTPQYAHEVSAADFHSGKSCERYVFQASAQAADQKIVFRVPPSRVFDELAASAWIRTTCVNVRMGIRIRFPHQEDPRTGESLAIDFLGQTYEPNTQWQQLACRTTQAAIRNRMIRARAQLASAVNSSDIDVREMYVDQVTFWLQLPAKTSVFQIDDLEFGPIVSPQRPVETTPRPTAPRHFQVTVEDDQIRKDGRSFFPILTLYHGESLDALVQQTGVNMLWIPDYQNAPLMEALSGMDVGIVAKPPQPSPEDALLNRAQIPRMPEATQPVSAWILGTEVPAAERDYVSSWADQVRAADRQWNRPVFVDVAGDERAFHRHVDVLGSSQFGIHTSLSTPDHYELMQARRGLALPTKPMLTFIQTEPADALLDRHRAGVAQPVVEPEQILQQAYQAVAAGYKGVGFWKQIPLDSEEPGLDERSAAMRIFAAHCAILEPLLASGRVVGDIQLQLDHGGSLTQKSAAVTPWKTRWDPTLQQASQRVTQSDANPVRATRIQTDHGMMILPIWYEEGAQCVPGRQTAPGIWTLVPGNNPLAYGLAWEVTPTSVTQTNLSVDTLSGGTELHLKDFDQHAVIVITTSAQDVDELRNRVRIHREPAARAFFELAEKKLSRVMQVHAELSNPQDPLAPPIRSAEPLLREANLHVERARQNLESGRWDDCRVDCQRALARMRELQRQHWESAMVPLSSPTESLLAVSFQTLPDHWRLMRRVQHATGRSENLLPSGGFEEEEDLVAKWRNAAPENRMAALTRGGTAANRYLQMALPLQAPLDQAAAIASPEIPVAAGNLIVVTGKILIPQTLARSDSRFLIYDTLAGRVGALRFTDQTSDWQSFRMIRVATKGEPFRLRFELYGPGNVCIDDVQVRGYDD